MSESNVMAMASGLSLLSEAVAASTKNLMPQATIASMASQLAPSFTALAAMNEHFIPRTNMGQGLSLLSEAVAASTKNLMPQATIASMASQLAPSFTALAAMNEHFIPRTNMGQGLSLLSEAVAASTKNLMPQATIASMASQLAPSFTALAAMNEHFIPRTNLATMAETIVNARVAALERGFTRTGTMATNHFGELRGAIAADQRFDGIVERTLADTQRPGSFGLDFERLQSDAEDLAEHLGREPDLDKQIRTALEPVQEVTGLDDELLIDVGDMLGWWRKAQKHKVSTAGVISALTIGLTTYVLNEGTGATPAPLAAFEAIQAGGMLYFVIHGLRSRK